MTESNKILTQLTLRAGVLTLAMVGVFFLLNTLLDGSVWEGMTVSKSALTVEYCEFNDVRRFFHQPMNTYSNLVYFFFGVVVWGIGWEDRRQPGRAPLNRLQHFPALSLLTGACFIYLSVGSAFFHASLTWVGQRVDMNGTYGLSLTLLSIAAYHVFHRVRLSVRGQRVAIGVLVGVILLFYQVHLWVPSRVLLPVLILLTWAGVLTHYVQFRRTRFLWLGVLSFVLIGLALHIRALDMQKVGCDPHSPFQGHSLWHLLAGLSSFCTYAFFSIHLPRFRGWTGGLRGSRRGTRQEVAACHSLSERANGPAAVRR